MVKWVSEGKWDRLDSGQTRDKVHQPLIWRLSLAINNTIPIHVRLVKEAADMFSAIEFVHKCLARGYSLLEV
jgi:hypothetical protein